MNCLENKYFSILLKIFLNIKSLSMNIVKAFVKRTGYTIGRMARETGLGIQNSLTLPDLAY